MALFNITASKVGEPLNAVTISTLTVSYCDPQTTNAVDNIAYHDGGPRDLQIGDTIYSDIGLTTLYNLTGSHKVYNTGDTALGFIELTPASVMRVPICADTNTDENIKIDSNDTTAAHLLNKIVAGTSIGFAINNVGGNETVTLNYTGGAPGAGSVTSVSAGNGMDFTTITGAGPVTMGTPGAISGSSTNALTSTSHTHSWTASIFDLSNVLETTLTAKAGKFLQVNSGETGFIYGDGFVPYSGATTNVDLNVKTLTNVSYLELSKTISASSGIDTPIYIDYNISNSGTAGYNLINADVTGTDTSSGEKNLINLTVGGAQKFRVDSNGYIHNMSGTRNNNINGTTYFDDTIYLKNAGVITNESATGGLTIAANGTTTISTIDVDTDYIHLTAAATNSGPIFGPGTETKYGVMVGRLWANTTDSDSVDVISHQMYFNETVDHSSHGASSKHYTLRLNPTITDAGAVHYAIHSATGDVVFDNALVTTPSTTTAQIASASNKILITREYLESLSLTNTFHDTYVWTGGTTSGPTASITGTAATISVAAVPSASVSASGIITTGTQSIAGAKTFSTSVTSPDFIGTSDERLKENIEYLQPKALLTNYVKYNFKGNEQIRVGVVAQDLEKFHPEFIRTDGKGFKSVSYQDLHSAEIAYLKQKLIELELWVLNNK